MSCTKVLVKINFDGKSLVIDCWWKILMGSFWYEIFGGQFFLLVIVIIRR